MTTTTQAKPVSKSRSTNLRQRNSQNQMPSIDDIINSQEKLTNERTKEEQAQEFVVHLTDPPSSSARQRQFKGSTNQQKSNQKMVVKETPNWRDRSINTSNNWHSQHSSNKDKSAIREEQPYGPSKLLQLNQKVPSQYLNKDILLDSMLQSSILQSSDKSPSLDLSYPPYEAHNNKSTELRIVNTDRQNLNNVELSININVQGRKEQEYLLGAQQSALHHL